MKHIRQHRQSWKYIWLVPAIILIPLVGYAVMHGAVYLQPLSEGGPFAQLMYTCFIIALGLLIPYWMLKLGVHKAHQSDRNEKEVRLKDIPKTQKALNKDK